MRGNLKGEPVEAFATILDKSANVATYDGIARRYGLMGKAFKLFSGRLRGGIEKNVTIELKAVK